MDDSRALSSSGTLWAAESSLRQLGAPSLEDALSYLALLAEVKPEKLERGCPVRDAVRDTSGESAIAP